MIDVITLKDVHYRIALNHPNWSISEEYVEENCFSELVNNNLIVSEDMVRMTVRMEVKNGQALLPRYVRRICHDIVHDDCPVIEEHCGCGCKQNKCVNKKVKIKDNKITYTRIGRMIRPKEISCGTIWADLELYPTDCNDSLLVPMHYMEVLVAYIEWKYHLMSVPSSPGQWDLMLINQYREEYLNRIGTMKAMAFGKISFDDMKRAFDMHKYRIFTNVEKL